MMKSWRIMILGSVLLFDQKLSGVQVLTLGRVPPEQGWRRWEKTCSFSMEICWAISNGILRLRFSECQIWGAGQTYIFLLAGFGVSCFMICMTAISGILLSCTIPGSLEACHDLLALPFTQSENVEKPQMKNLETPRRHQFTYLCNKVQYIGKIWYTSHILQLQSSSCHASKWPGKNGETPREKLPTSVFATGGAGSARSNRSDITRSWAASATAQLKTFLPKVVWRKPSKRFRGGIYDKSTWIKIMSNNDCPWTPKLWKMKVLHPKLWVTTPKNEGCGFPWWFSVTTTFRRSRWHPFPGFPQVARPSAVLYDAVAFFEPS